jgi:hypothetical protein
VFCRPAAPHQRHPPPTTHHPPGLLFLPYLPLTARTHKYHDASSDECDSNNDITHNASVLLRPVASSARVGRVCGPALLHQRAELVQRRRDDAEAWRGAARAPSRQRTNGPAVHRGLLPWRPRLSSSRGPMGTATCADPSQVCVRWACFLDSWGLKRRPCGPQDNCQPTIRQSNK